MIESCPKKRMVLGIGFLTLLTIFVLIVESRWTTNSRHTYFRIEQNSTCKTNEEFEIIKDCHPCTAFEIASKSQGVCIHTHYKEILRCKSGETVTKSCDRVAWLDEKNYWTFQGSLLIVGVLSTFLSFLRQKSLDRKTMLKVQRQLGQA